MSAWEILQTYWLYQGDVQTPQEASAFPDLIPGIEAYLRWLDSLVVVCANSEARDA